MEFSTTTPNAPRGEKTSLKKYFIAGLATLLPLAITIYLVRFIVGLLTSPFMGVMMDILDAIPFGIGSFLHAEQTIRIASQICILIFLFLFVLGLGMVGRWFVVHQLLKWSDRIFLRIPLVSKVYKTASDFVHTLFSSEQKSFQQVVLVPFPYPQAYCIGLISRETSPNSEDVFVFIPTTPNPASGFLIICKRSELTPISISTEEAVKYVVSCGVVKPGEKSGEKL